MLPENIEPRHASQLVLMLAQSMVLLAGPSTQWLMQSTDGASRASYALDAPRLAVAAHRHALSPLDCHSNMLLGPLPDPLA